MCARSRNLKQIVEIGVSEEYTTHSDRAHCPRPGDLRLDPLSKAVFISADAVERQIRTTGFGVRSGKLKFILTMSTEVYEGVPATTNLVLVNADHRLDWITTGSVLWSKLVPPGESIVFHESRVSRHSGAVYHLGGQRYFESHVPHHLRLESSIARPLS